MRCMNPTILGSLAVVGVAVYVLAPSAVSTAAPLLLLLACPLSMVGMMAAMDRGRRPQPAEPQAAAIDDPSEVVRLRAEVDQLRAAVAQRVPQDAW